MVPSLTSPLLSNDSITNQVVAPNAVSEENKEAGFRKSAQDFEAAYIAQMLTFSGLDKALMAGGGEEVSAFTSFYIESFAEQIAEKGGFGLADNFYDQLVKLNDLQNIEEEFGENGEVNNVDFGKL